MDNMVTGTTKSGFSFEIDPDALNDWDTLELIGVIHNGDAMAKFAVFDLIKRLLGEEQTNRLKDHCRNEKGFVPLDIVQNELFDILSVKTVKNSSTSPG